MSNMRIPALLLAAAAFLSAADVKDFSKTVPLEAKGRFSLDTYKGSIRIAVWDQPRAEIRAHIETDFGWHAIPADEVEIRVDAFAGDVRVKTDYLHHFENGTLPLVHYDIHLPRGASLRVKDYKSESQISGVQGEIEFESYKGTARIEGIQGAFDLNTYKGDIRAILTRFSAPGKVNTYKGGIDLSLPSSSAFEIHANLERHAGFECDFPRTIHSTGRLSHVDGAVNGGGAALHVTSYRGNIHLRSI
jgi:hypothetical protein